MTKSVGEFWVSATMARLGWATALTRDGLERTDILAVRADKARDTVEVQVKAANGADPRTSWTVNSKAQSPALSGREWFVFVAIPGDVTLPPRAFVVPRNVVGAVAWILHEHWRTDPDVPKGKRNAPVDRARVTLPWWQGYENRWDLMEESAYDAPVLLDPVLREWALMERVGLPPEHPWRDTLPDW